MSDEPTAIGPDQDRAATCRALVVVDARADLDAAAGEGRPSADFVTQLIACERRLPAFRRAGRAEPGAGARVYARGPVPLRAELNLVV